MLRLWLVGSMLWITFWLVAWAINRSRYTARSLVLLILAVAATPVWPFAFGFIVFYYIFNKLAKRGYK